MLRRSTSSSSKVVDCKIDQHLQQEMPLPKPGRKQKQTAATTKWKENMKANDPEKYEAFQEKRREHVKEKRKNMSDEQRAKQREQSRLRMNAKRERDRLSKHVEKPPKTRPVQEEKRKGWTEGKQTYRANMSAQTKRRVNEKRRSSYHQKKEVSQSHAKMVHQLPIKQVPVESRNATAKRKSMSQALSAMPNTARRSEISRKPHTTKSVCKHLAYNPAASLDTGNNVEGAASAPSLAMASAPSLAMTSAPSLAMTSAPSLAMTAAPTLSIATTSPSSLSMTCDSCYQLTLMLRLDSDWIRPVMVTLTNATVSSSKVIGSSCHVTKIIDEQTVQLIAPMKHESKVAGGGVGNAVIDLGSSNHDTGTGDLGPERTVVDLGLGTGSGGLGPERTVVDLGLDAGSGDLDPGNTVVFPRCSDTDIGSSVGDTGSKDHDPGHSLCHPGNDARVSGTDVSESAGQISVGDPGNKTCDSKRNVLDPGSIACDLGNGVHGSENVPTDASNGVHDLGLGNDVNDSGSGIHKRESLESDPGNAAHEQGCDLGGDVDLVEEMDSMSEIDNDDVSSDTSMSEDDVPYQYKDDTMGDPDWDPDCPSDFPNKPATRRNSVETAGCNDDDMRITDNSSDSDGDAEKDMKVDEFSSVKCQSCDFCCRTQVSLTNHVMQEHYDEASRNEKHICMDCGQVEDTVEALQQHTEVAHPVTKEHKCAACDETFTSSRKYRSHRRDKHKFKCTKCVGCFWTEDKLAQHTRRAHRVRPVKERASLKSRKVRPVHKPRSFICEICGFHTQLQRTIQVCPHCQKEFVSKSRLKIHVETVHLKNCKVACSWPGCTKLLNRKSHLQVHMRIHKDEKPLACPHCDFRARQRHALNYHLSRNHKDVTAATNVTDSSNQEPTIPEVVLSGICTSESIG